MFAVKGWSVDAASLKAQTEVVKPSDKGSNESGKSGRKRKRNQTNGSSGPQNEDVGRLWERHIEGKRPPKKQKKEKRKRPNRDENRERADVKEASSKRSVPEESTTPPKNVPVTQKTPSASEKPNKNRNQDLANAHEITAPNNTQSESKGPHQETSNVGKLTSMQSAMRQKLVSARFRHLNETLYTKPSAIAQELFDENPGMFEDYHAGFRQQVSVWPENPIDNIIAEIRSRGKVRAPRKDKKGHIHDRKPGAVQNGELEALPRTHGTCIIADLGCGDARLAELLQKAGNTTQLNLKLHSFDLHSPSPLVTKADISNVPLENGSVDVAIFCLALMGTNWISFIDEAYRILHWRGELWIAEIKSRFGRISKSGKVVEHSVGTKRKQAALKAAKEAKNRAEDDRNEQDVLQTEVDGVVTNKEETDVSAFVDVLKRRGFALKTVNGRGVDLSNKMFVKVEFVKVLTPTKGQNVPDETAPGQKKAKTKFVPEADDEVTTEDEASTLKPCLYKIR